MRVQPEVREVQYADHLPDATLAVIGLWNMGYTDLDTVASLLWIVNTKPLKKLYKTLKRTRNPLIRRFVDVGLPAGVYRPLPLAPGPLGGAFTALCHHVRCPLCGAQVDWVPCPKCSLKDPRVAEVPVPLRDREVCLCATEEPTSFVPGSPEKIELMRQRAERGQQLFHCRDRKLPSNGKKLR
jgi:hypothetical protein